MTRAIALACFAVTIFGCSNAARRNGGGGGSDGGGGGGAHQRHARGHARRRCHRRRRHDPADDRLSSARPKRKRRHRRLHVCRRGFVARQLQRRDLSSERQRRRHHARPRHPRQRRRQDLAHRAHQESRDHPRHSVGRAREIRRPGDRRATDDGLPARRHAHPAELERARGAVHAAGRRDALRGRLRRPRARSEDLHDLRRRRWRLRASARRGHVEAPQPRLGLDHRRRHLALDRWQWRSRRQRRRAQALVRRRRPAGRPLLLGGRVGIDPSLRLRPAQSDGREVLHGAAVGRHLRRLPRLVAQRGAHRRRHEHSRPRRIAHARRRHARDALRLGRHGHPGHGRRRLELRSALARRHARARQQRRQPRAHRHRQRHVARARAPS